MNTPTPETRTMGDTMTAMAANLAAALYTIQDARDTQGVVTLTEGEARDVLKLLSDARDNALRASTAFRDIEHYVAHALNDHAYASGLTS